MASDIQLASSSFASSGRVTGAPEYTGGRALAHASRMRLVSSDIRAPDDILPRFADFATNEVHHKGEMGGGVTRCTPQRQVGSIRAATDEGGLSTRCARACASHCAVVRPWPDAVVNLPTWYQVGPPWPTNPAARATHILFTAAPIDMASHGSLGIKDPHCALTGPSVSGVPF